MLWISVIALTLVSCAALLLAARPRPAAAGTSDADQAFFRSQLAGIEEDVALGRISEREATAAKAELAREVIRAEKLARPSPVVSGVSSKALMALVPVIAIASLAVYGFIGRADLPAQPLADRIIDTDQAEISLEDAVAQVEARLVDAPNDIRGWQALGPVYMQLGRYAEAANAFRRILELEPPTADRETDLAEALMMTEGGVMQQASRTLLESAIERDPQHVRSRFYLAGELTRLGQYDDALPIWDDLLELATGEEPWVATARAGQAAAQAGVTGEQLDAPVEDGTSEVMIRGMVEGLASRLYENGGTADEWAQLVRSRMVLDGVEAARGELDRALAQLVGEDRAVLDALALELGLNEEQ